MKEIVFATNNPNKLKELREKVGSAFNILSLKDIGCNEELPETQRTLNGNAIEKADYVAKKYNVDCFADDTGLEVNALNGEPGVYSARYAGPDCDPEKNMDLVLKRMNGVEDREASFSTVIALIQAGEVSTFEGTVEGNIRNERSGVEGFGYDPIFEPKGYKVTFAEMSSEEKNSISHRGRAVEKLINYLLS